MLGLVHAGLEALEGIVGEDGDDGLGQHRPGIHFRGDLMHHAAAIRDLPAPVGLEGPSDHIAPGEHARQGRVEVDHPAGESIQKGRAEDAHPPGQDDPHRLRKAGRSFAVFRAGWPLSDPG
jgi:hypothetical protein